MGKGRIKSTSDCAYEIKTNKNVRNKEFIEDNDTKTNRTPRSIRYMPGLDGLVKLHRVPESVSYKDATNKIYNLIKQYENLKNIKLENISKIDLMVDALDYIDKNLVIFDADDSSRLFMVVKLRCIEKLKLYLYKMLYPMIFDYDKVLDDENKETIKFKNSYIRENIKTIYVQVEYLVNSLLIDSMVIAINERCMEELLTIENSTASLEFNETIDDLDEIICCDVEKIPRIIYLKNYKESIMFLAERYKSIRKKDSNDRKKIISLMKMAKAYKGKRMDDNRYALRDNYNFIKNLLEYEDGENDKDKKHFMRILNMYYLNKAFWIFDLGILKNNCDFKSYKIDGIVTKYHLNNIITENAKMLSKIEVDNDMGLSLIYNNSNCVVMNLTSRDYEMLDFVITRTAKCIARYYLMNDDNYRSPCKLNELISFLNEDVTVKKLSKAIKITSLNDIDKADYDEIQRYKNIPNYDLQDDGVEC